MHGQQNIRNLHIVYWQLLSDYSGQTIATETSITRCQPTQHGIANERKPQRHRGCNLTDYVKEPQK
jgi:hypothetical protein